MLQIITGQLIFFQSSNLCLKKSEKTVIAKNTYIVVFTQIQIQTKVENQRIPTTTDHNEPQLTEKHTKSCRTLEEDSYKWEKKMKTTIR